MAEKKRISGKELKRTKQLIAICVMVLIISMIFLIISRAHSKQRILNKLLAGMDNLNYSYLADDEVTSVKVFGKKEKRINQENDVVTYVDYETNYSLDVFEEEQYKEEYTNNGIEEMPYYQQFIKAYFMSNGYDYKYIGKEHENSKEYIVVEFKDKSEVDGRRFIARLWIDNSLYIVAKEETFIEKNKERIPANEYVYNYYTNENTLSDVQVPESVKNYSDNTNN